LRQNQEKIAMRQHWIYLGLAASAGVLCAAPWPPQWNAAAGGEQSRRHVTIRGLKVTVMPACNGAINIYGEPPTAKIARVVRVTVPSHFDIGDSVSRNVRENTVAGGESSEGPLDNGTTGSPIGETTDPPFDMTLTGYPIEEKFTQVRVVLMDARFKFYDKENIEGVAAGDKLNATSTNTLELCGAHLYPADGGTHTKPVALFYVPMNAQRGQGNYNFVLVPTANQTLQIAIDPQVKNGGG
jgi:hypothetical protein